ncbi:hypothetical protein HK100_002665 [Physocladia obscura]|uniref:PRELI/MSF1 domain-containing protein n=1 Tax=Physocladia obscura TaxID=109957 RepID=A0AAD5XA29_9FUNG|nr:hypothetical protein HK100_002665 [Physocladia obscura]
MANHVLTSDVISRHVDPITGVLHTTRLMTKEGRVPKWAKAMFKIKEALILEISQLDPVNKTFKITTRNLSHAKIMLIEETQTITPFASSSFSATNFNNTTNTQNAVNNNPDVDIVSIPTSSLGAVATMGTAIHISARIISNTGWASIRSKIEAFGASKIKENTLKSSKGLMHVIEELKRKKLVV